MRKKYSHDDIEKWADYSGDRNNIHFDKSIAVKNGLRDVIVQGMLILLDAKIALSRSIVTDSEVSFFIKKPVIIDTDVDFSIREVNHKKILTVHEVNEPKSVCVTANVLPQKAPELIDKKYQMRVSEEFVNNYIDILRKYYPNIQVDWILLDTLLFCISFNQQKADYFHRQALKLTGNNEISDITTFHVAQKLFIAKNMTNSSGLHFQNMSFIVEEKDIYIHDDSAYSAFNISVIEDEKVVFQSSMGCLTKLSTGYKGN
ncbi:hypothetical protein J0B02_00220 [Enterobacteriaceae bacterium YMB-R22]|uniref:MaoC/PaaZ C-terminal domain-containing protein n=1 Tax=Tenebrionicola larvae TaxID=2815733 RepID=UPI00201123F6|nr:MaoC/PaaZ C-terminal domain-containing protein [Tenebrionicola larvae]MBV4411283.1 hypothetical protein [Tenebrionicola larvae]